MIYHGCPEVSKAPSGLAGTGTASFEGDPPQRVDLQAQAGLTSGELQ